MSDALGIRLVFKACPVCRSPDLEEEGEGWFCNECGNTSYLNLEIQIRPLGETANE